MNLFKELKTARFALVCLIFVPFQASFADSIGFALNNESSTPTGQMTVTVKNDLTGEPVADAMVAVGNDIGATDMIREKTSATGIARVRSVGTPGQVIHVFKEGFTSLSIVGVKSTAVRIDLKPLPPADVVMHGTLKGFPPADDDSKIQLGIVFKSLSVFDLLNFSVKSLISPLKDTIDVFGPRKIPSNIVLPPQKVSITFGSVELNKPDYRIPASNQKPVQMTGAQGELNVSDAMGLSGGFKLEFLNKIRFTKVGISEKTVPSADLKQDLSSTMNLVPYHQVTVNQPPFESDVLTAAVIDVTGNRETLMATDIKVPLPALDLGGDQEITLASTESQFGSSRAVLTIAVGEQGKRLTGIVTDAAGKIVQPGEFISIPHLDPAKELPSSVPVIAPSEGVAAVLFEAAPAAGSDKPVPAWLVYVLPGAGEVRVPTAKLGMGPAIQKYSLLKLQFGKGFDESAMDGRTIMKTLSHFASAWAKIGN